MNPSLKPINPFSRLRKWPRWSWVVILVAAGTLLWFWFQSGGHSEAESATFAARRGPLNITVLEGGSVKAVESQEIKCEVRVGYQGLKILKIVEEGYEVTADDIRTNKVLVGLDSSDLQKQIVQQDIQFESAAASLTDGQQNYEIQLNQNLSDIKAAEQKARFARMDFDKFLSDKVTQAIVDQLGLEKELATEQTNALARSAAVVASLPNRGETRQAPAASTIGAGLKPAPMAVAGAPTNTPALAATATAPSKQQPVAATVTTNEPPKPEPALA
jgi:hypothetical protein